MDYDKHIVDVNERVMDATDKFLDRRSLIFIEEAISHYSARHGIKETRRYLQYMLEYLEEFET